ncbi:MAG: hypothetical protein IPJ65_23455 [Archangiaceae bacterium]|nr:hypothetical protein [Archangiaceae bacterium]
MSRLLALSLCSLFTACATARVVGPEVVRTADPNFPRVVVIEPFFETAEWETVSKEYLRNDTLQPMGGFMLGPGSPTVTVTQTQKPLYAQLDSLVTEHRAVLDEVQKQRPSWRVSSTSGLAALEGPVTVVRVIIEGNQVIGSDRALKNTAFAFGLVILPLQIYNFWPVTETMRGYGTLERFLTDAPTVKQRAVRYQTQPDAAFNASGFSPLRRGFGLDVTFEEGLLADEAPRGPVLLSAFSERLASAIVAIVEEP